MQSSIFNLLNIWAVVQRSQFIVSVISCVLIFLSKSLMLEDNDEKCWTQIVPFYGTYVMYRAFWKKHYFWFLFVPCIVAFISFIAAIVVGISTFLSHNFDITLQESFTNIFALQTYSLFAISLSVFIFTVLIIWLFSIILLYNISKKYDYDGGFTLGLYMMPFVFYTILGIKCLNSGVLKRISNGRKVFMIVIVALIIVSAVVFYQNYLTDAAIINRAWMLPNFNIE